MLVACLLASESVLLSLQKPMGTAQCSLYHQICLRETKLIVFETAKTLVSGNQSIWSF